VGYISDGQARIPILDRGLSVADAFVERFVLEPRAHGALQGTSFAAKDNFDVAGCLTGCGNPTWRATHAAPLASAACVELLLRAGAKLLGKTCMDELAYSLEGRNFHTGAPLNSAAVERFTGGSSSGAASAVAANDVDFGLATDTAGSVRVPAAWCGLVGMRPTHGRVSVQGLTPLAPSFDTVGWLTRSPALARTIGGVLLGERHALQGQISLLRDPAVEHLAQDVGPSLLRQALERCAAHGLGVGEVSLGVDLEGAATALRILQGNEVWSTHGRWLDAVRPSVGPAIAERLQIARALSRSEVHDAELARAAFNARLDAVLPPGRILCLPTVPGAAPLRAASSQALQSMRARLLPLTALASLSGRPQITLPLLRLEGAPVGFSLLGWRDGDEALMRIAETISA
jgi:amidase